MRVFVIGATGFIGSAIVRDLIASGHQVIGLTRTQAAAVLLVELDAEVHAGDLAEPGLLDDLAASRGFQTPLLESAGQTSQ